MEPLLNRWMRKRIDSEIRKRRKQFPSYRGAAADGSLSTAYENLIRQYAPGHSFIDIGCMWRLHGRVAFMAEECGATAVTAFDAMDRTPEFESEFRRRKSSVDFVQGNLIRDPEWFTKIGSHDVVWCTGVLYHTPNPYLLVSNLLQITRKILVIGTKTVPEIPGFPNATIFFPALTPQERLIYTPLWGDGIGQPFGLFPWQGAEWWWGFTLSAFCGLFKSFQGWKLKETVQAPYSAGDDDAFVVAERH